MSCSSCKKVEVSMGHSGLNYTFDTESDPVTDIFGKAIDMAQPIAKKPHAPLGGWGVDFFINSIQTRFEGATAEAVYQNVTRTFELNEIQFNPKDLWLNLNIQWLQKVPKKYRKIALSQLMSVAIPLEYQTTSDPHSKSTDFTIQKQKAAWGLLEVYLCVAQSKFSFNRFIVLAEAVKDLYSPEKSPFSGTVSSFQKIVLNFENLSNSPTYKIEDARAWLWAVMVDLGLSNMSFEKYATENLWI